MSFQEAELRKGRSPVINYAQFIRAVADNMKQRLITAASNRAHPSVSCNSKKEPQNSCLSNGCVRSRKIENENSRFGEDEVKSLCVTLRLNKQGNHFAYIEFKASGGRSIPQQLN